MDSSQEVVVQLKTLNHRLEQIQSSFASMAKSFEAIASVVTGLGRIAQQTAKERVEALLKEKEGE
jgi:methyl-accepting chemotaxis protein